MMPLTASAPGKLVLAGEYAVLDGATALVMAIDRRARVTLHDADADYCVDATDLGISGARCRLDAAGRVRWVDIDGVDAVRLGLVTAALEAVAEAGAPAPFRAELDTHLFFTGDVDHAKLGLGSSAALLVALAGAICAREGRGAPPVATLIAAHRRLQQGRGSGLDIATSLTGGLVRYRLRDGAPQIGSAVWPTGLAFCCVWSGRPASTSRLLQQMDAWRECAPARHAALIDELGECSAAASAAVEADDAPGLLHAVRSSAAVLARLGEASGLDIVCAEHRRITAIAAACGATYKSCGAGSGDIGIALALESECLQALRRRLAEAGFAVLDTALEAHGLLIGA